MVGPIIAVRLEDLAENNRFLIGFNQVGFGLLEQPANLRAKVFHDTGDSTLRGYKDNNQRQNQDAYESIKSSSAHKTTF